MAMVCASMLMEQCTRVSGRMAYGAVRGSVSLPMGRYMMGYGRKTMCPSGEWAHSNSSMAECMNLARDSLYYYYYDYYYQQGWG